MEEEEQVYPDIAFDFTPGRRREDATLFREPFSPMLFRPDNVGSILKRIVMDRIVGAATVYDFAANGIQFNDGLELASMSVYRKTASPFGAELSFKHQLATAGAYAANALRVLAMGSQEVEDAVGSKETAALVGDVYKNAFFADGGEVILGAARCALDAYTRDVVDSDRELFHAGGDDSRVPVSFLQRLRDMYDHPLSDQLSAIVSIVDYISSYASATYCATLDRLPFSKDDNTRSPMVWYLFSVQKTVNHPLYGVRGVLNLHGWTKSLLGIAHHEMNKEVMPHVGVVALSLLADVASDLLGMPISLIYLESLPTTDRVIASMRKTCGIQVPLVSANKMRPIGLENGNLTLQVGDVVFVYPEFRACWKKYTTSHHPSIESKRKRPRRVKAHACVSCKVSGVQLYTAEGDASAGLYCSKECYLH